MTPCNCIVDVLLFHCIIGEREQIHAMEYVDAKTILSGWRDSDGDTGGWFGCNYNMNLYRGCCHGCIYCDSRSQCYGIDRFDTVRAKKDALVILERELKSRRRRGMVGIGAMSDSYNPFEKDERLTQGALELLEKYGFGVMIDTKSDLITRDIGLLSSIAEKYAAVVNFTITTADDALCRRIEQRVCPTSARLEAMRKMSGTGISVGVILTPVLPFINDTEENLLSVARLAAEAGARWVFPWQSFGVTLRQNQRLWYYDRLDEQFPGLRRRYTATYGERYECTVPDNRRLMAVFAEQCRRLGLLWRIEDINAYIRSTLPPSPVQLSLFD